LIGALALAFYDVVRATKDLDLLILLSPLEMAGLVAKLRAEGVSATAQRGAPGDPVVGVVVTQVPAGGTQIKCDLLLPSARWQSEAIRNAQTFEAVGLAVRVVQARDLFLLKLYAGGPQDLIDASQLLRRQDKTTRSAWKEAASKLRMGEDLKRCLLYMAEEE